MENIVSNIKAFRKAKGMTQEELGTKSGLHKETIYYFEKAKRMPRVDHLTAIYKALGIKLTLTYEAIVEEDE